MATDEQVAQWQAKLDRQFPYGLVAHFEDGSTGRPAYLVPRVVVTGMAGLDPMVWMSAFAMSDKVLGPWQVQSYEEIPGHPHAVRVLLEGGTMRWNAVRPGGLARAMSGERARLFALAPEGGEAVVHGTQKEGAA